jgi:hypothetical protein
MCAANSQEYLVSEYISNRTLPGKDKYCAAAGIGWADTEGTSVPGSSWRLMDSALPQTGQVIE